MTTIRSNQQTVAAQTSSTSKAARATPASPAQPTVKDAPAAGSEFQKLKKKPLSVSGRYKPVANTLPVVGALKDVVKGLRLSGTAAPTGLEIQYARGGGRTRDAAPLSAPHQAATDALKTQPKVAANDPWAQHITGVRKDLARAKLPTSAEGVRVFVIGENDPNHGPSVVRTVAGKATGLAPGADVQLSGHRLTMDQAIAQHPRAAEFVAIESKVRSGRVTLDELATQGVIGGDAALDKMRAALADARSRLPNPSDGKTTIVNMSWGESPRRLAEQLLKKLPPNGPEVRAVIAGFEASEGEPFNPQDPAHQQIVADKLAEKLADAIVAKVDGAPESASHRALAQEVGRARAAGMLPFNSAGNEFMTGGQNGSRNFSHDIPGLITVGNVDFGNVRSKRDDKLNFNSGGGQVEIAAPGTGVPVHGSGANTHAQKVDGTSFSSPYVAGVAALMVKANPKITPGQIEAILLDPKNSGAVEQGSHTGNVRNLDPAKAVLAAKQLKS